MDDIFTHIFECVLIAGDVYDVPKYISIDEQRKLLQKHVELDILSQHQADGIMNEIIDKDKLTKLAYIKGIDIRLKNRGWIRAYDYDRNGSADGFFARLYYNREFDLPVLAIRGTVLSNAEDIEADIALARNKTSPMLGKTADFLQKMLIEDDIFTELKKMYNFPVSRRLNLVGHSLGGYLATYLATWNQCNTIAFNAPGIGGLKGAPHIPYVDPHKKYDRILYIDDDCDIINTRGGTKIGRRHLMHRFIPTISGSIRFYAGAALGAEIVAPPSVCPSAYSSHIISNMIAEIEHANPKSLVLEGYGDPVIEAKINNAALKAMSF